MSGVYNRYSGQSVDRIQGLADGVFAVAMTLLVLDVRLPDRPAASSRELWSLLGDIGPNLAAYLLSFTMLGTFWLALHAVLGLCSDSDRRLSWAALAFLFFVTTLPFSASVLAGHVHVRLAIVVYWVNLLALGAAIGWVIRQVALLTGPEQHEGLVLVRRRLYLAQALYAVAALLMVFSTTVSIVAFAVAQLFFMISPRLPFRA